MQSFRGWVHDEVARQFKRWIPKPGHDVIDETINVIRHRAEQRARKAVLQHLDAQEAYQWNVGFHHALDAIVYTAVAGIFGEEGHPTKIPPGTLACIMDEINAEALQAAWTAQPIQKQATNVTLGDVKMAAEQMKQAGYGPVIMGTQRPGKKPWGAKSGLPAAQDVQVKKMMEEAAEESALASLAAKVEKASDKLLGIKQRSKYEELVGVDPEDV